MQRLWVCLVVAGAKPVEKPLPNDKSVRFPTTHLLCTGTIPAHDRPPSAVDERGQKCVQR